MRIGILTYHRVVNDGSVIQAYCLQQILRTIYSDADVEIIDYRPIRGELAEFRKIISFRYPFVVSGNWMKLRSVRTFLSKFSSLSSVSCTTDSLRKARDFIRGQKYDALIVGSDTVWEARHSSVSPPFPNIYYLPDLTEVKRIAFAASADPILPEFVKEKQRAEQIRNYIEAFDFISVRDDATRYYLIGLGLDPTKVNVMPDPTLLWDFSKLADRPRKLCNLGKHLAGVFIGISDTKIRTQVDEQLRRIGYNILHLSNLNEIEDFFALPVHTVNQRLGVHASLNLMITDRFHSSIFTLMLAKAPVIFVETASKWPEQNSKGRDLFRRLGIETMVWRYEGDGFVPKDLIESKLNNWHKVSPRIPEHLMVLRQSAEETLKCLCMSLDHP